MDLKIFFLKQRDPLEIYYNNLVKRWWENDSRVKKYLISKACKTWSGLVVIAWEKGRRQSQGVIWGAGKEAWFYLKSIEIKAPVWLPGTNVQRRWNKILFLKRRL